MWRGPERHWYPLAGLRLGGVCQNVAGYSIRSGCYADESEYHLCLVNKDVKDVLRDSTQFSINSPTFDGLNFEVGQGNCYRLFLNLLRYHFILM